MLAPSSAHPPDMAAALQHGFSPLATDDSGRRQFKKHKMLPRPPSQRSNYDQDGLLPSEPKFDLALLDAATISSTSGSRSPSPTRELKHQRGRIGAGPDLPPTPPAHSRASSSSHSAIAIPSSPTITGHNLPPSKNAQALPPSTPPDQRSPPTPDVTPPQPITRPRALRPGLSNRANSRTTTAESRTESFKTAREDPESSEEDDSRSTVRGALASGRTSQQTVRKLSNPNDNRIPHPEALDMALSKLESQPEDLYTPRTRGEFGKFDGEWDQMGDVGLEWDDNRTRGVTVRLRNVSTTNASPIKYRRGVVEDDDMEVTPSQATRAVQQISLKEKNTVASSPPSRRNKSASRAIPPSTSETSVDVAKKRASVASSRSVSSTVGALVVDGRPQRQRTLRHVRKQSELRNVSAVTDWPTTTATVTATTEPDSVTIQSELSARPERGRRHESYTSNATVSSIASGKTRREVWKSGGIPVVVVPDRWSSNRSTSREPSLRSTSSRRSRRTASLGSAPFETPVFKELGPVFDRASRRSHTMSFSDHSELTIDFPPAIPRRSSSLSAPTSRNVSRAGSMTAESVRARDTLRHHLKHPAVNDVAQHNLMQNESAVEDIQPSTLLLPPHIITSRADHTEPAESHDGDRFDDAASMKKFTARNTPFSVMSVETNGTAPEVSEAQAIQMYPHQNSSLLMVNHSNKPSDASDISRKEFERQSLDAHSVKVNNDIPTSEALPMTPPQPQIPHFALEDVDSPLRNPRPPPEPPSQAPGQPPVLAFIPATPSGITPGPDVAIQMGNFYEAIAEPPPPERRKSLVRRALTRRNRGSVEYPPNASRTPRFLTRAFSLTRRRSSSRRREISDSPPYRTDFPQEGDEPREGAKLHPYWRPFWSEDEYDDEDDWRYSRSRSSDFEEEDEHLRYPLVDNRPSRGVKRSFSDKVKKTIAALPRRSEEYYATDDENGPERRTIKRTPSGNLRVIRRLTSMESFKRRSSQPDRPFTAPEEDESRGFWRGASVRGRIRESSRRRRNSLGESLEELQNLPRRFSERRREKRSRELRQQISGPTEVRDGVEDVIRSGYYRENGNANRF